uniref:Uncharacterized protein n=1 Tax=Acrobeloides nanus TaxID=290746 RepID=A0A914EG89_9BILA
MASNNFSSANSSEFQTIDIHFVNGIKTRQCVNFWIDTFATLFALIVIIWKSPKEMKTYKWFLLNIVIWSYLMDVNLTLIYVPLSLFPAPVMCILGVADRIENLFYANYVVIFLLIELLGACGAAIVCALYYRYRSVMGQPIDIFHKKSVILGIALFHLVNGLPCLICLIYASEQSVPNIVKYVTETFPTVPNLYWLKCGALDVSALSAKIFVTLCASEILLYVLIVVSGSVYVYVCHKRMLAKSSEKIRSLERQWIIALIIQVCEEKQPFPSSL